MRLHAQTDSETTARLTANQLNAEGRRAAVIEGVVFNAVQDREYAHSRYVIVTAF